MKPKRFAFTFRPGTPRCQAQNRGGLKISSPRGTKALAKAFGRTVSATRSAPRCLEMDGRLGAACWDTGTEPLTVTREQIAAVPALLDQNELSGSENQLDRCEQLRRPSQPVHPAGPSTPARSVAEGGPSDIAAIRTTSRAALKWRSDRLNPQRAIRLQP